jgi:7-cyano-7-deazaguanine synthase
MTKKAIVVHSGGMDSSICLALAIHEFGKENVLSLSFSYGQRHSQELVQAAKICRDWGVEHIVHEMDIFSKINADALTNHQMPIEHQKGTFANTLVIGRNGLMVHVAGLYAAKINAQTVFMGVIGLEESNSGYRDCSREYMDLKEKILRLDLDNPQFEIRTPLVHMTKKQTLQLALELGILEYLKNETITCYEGLFHPGCQKCPACILRNDAFKSIQI